MSSLPLAPPLTARLGRLLGSRRGRWLLAALLGLAGLLAWHFTRPAPAPRLITAPAVRADLEETVLASGTLEAFREVSVGAQVSGQLKTLKVRLGDTVKAGQLIGEIDSLPQQNTLREREAALATVRAQHAARQAALRQSELALARQRALLAEDATSRAEFEAAEANFQAQRAELAALAAQIAQATVAVDTARLNVGYTRLTAPISGTVVAIITQEGQTVSAGLQAPTILKLARTDVMTVKAQISEADVPRVRAGQKVYFTILGDPDHRYHATLRAVEPAPESRSQENASSGSAATTAAVYYNGLFDVDNPDGQLRVAMTAQVNIVLAEARGVLTVPATALGEKDRDGRYRLRVRGRDGQVQERQVRIGLSDGVRTEVREGLAEGEQVVLGEAGSDGMTERDRRRAAAMMRM